MFQHWERIGIRNAFAVSSARSLSLALVSRHMRINPLAPIASTKGLALSALVAPRLSQVSTWRSTTRCSTWTASFAPDAASLCRTAAPSLPADMFAGAVLDRPGPCLGSLPSPIFTLYIKITIHIRQLWALSFYTSRKEHKLFKLIIIC